MTPSSKYRTYSRFIPSEEIADVTRWKFGAVDGSDLLEPVALPEPEVLEDVPEPISAVEQQAQHQQDCHESHAQGYTQGYAQGQAQTALEWQRRLDEYIAQQGDETAQRLQSVLENFEASVAVLQQQMAQQVLELACDIARQVVRQDLTVNPSSLLAVVREAVGMVVSEGRPATVRLNPADLQSLGAPERDGLGVPALQWVADPEVPAGGCLVSSAGTVVDGSLDKRWRRAVAALGQESLWTEAIETVRADAND